MKAEEVLDLYTVLLDQGVQLWIDGGWGIDALLGQQTRPHKDLDAFVAFKNLATLTAVLRRRGFFLNTIWDENRWRPHPPPVALIGRDEAGGAVATAFVLKDALGRELDIHVLDLDDHGLPTPAWASTLSFSDDALRGHGVIAGVPVRCLTAAMQVRTHRGYVLTEKDIQDLRHLADRFGTPTPE